MRQAAPLEPPAAPEDASAGSIVAGMALAGALVGYGMRRRGVFGLAAGAAGAGLLASIVAPRLAPHITRATGAYRPVDVERSFVVHRHVADVFAFFRNFEHFPLLGGVLHGVDDFDDGRSRWRIRGRQGAIVEWDVIVTKYVPQRVIAWESIGNGPVESAGTVRFRALGEAETQVDVNVHYLPRTELAAQALRPLISRPERRVRAAIGRVEAAMSRAEQPGFYDRVPSHPLPDPSTQA